MDNEFKKKIILIITTYILLCSTIYVCFAFGNWSINPDNWIEFSRWWAAIIMLLLMFLVMAIYLN